MTPQPTPSAKELTPKPRDAPTAKAISDKIDNMIIRFKTPVGPKFQHDANIHADGWNDAIRAVQKGIEPNLQALEALDRARTTEMQALRAKADEVQEQMALRFNMNKRPTWGDIANWIELLNPTEETATAIIAEIEASQKAREDEGVKGLTDNREPDSAKSVKDKEEE